MKATDLREGQGGAPGLGLWTRRHKWGQQVRPHKRPSTPLGRTQAGSASSPSRLDFPFSPLCFSTSFPPWHWLGWRIRGVQGPPSLSEAQPTVLQAASLARSLGHQDCQPVHRPGLQGSVPSFWAPDPQARQPLQALTAAPPWPIPHA